MSSVFTPFRVPCSLDGPSADVLFIITSPRITSLRHGQPNCCARSALALLYNSLAWIMLLTLAGSGIGLACPQDGRGFAGDPGWPFWRSGDCISLAAIRSLPASYSYVSAQCRASRLTSDRHQTCGCSSALRPESTAVQTTQRMLSSGDLVSVVISQVFLTSF